jgi:hypothetical protein
MKDEPRFDLISPYALKALADTYAEGAKKYGDRNYLKGLPYSNLINHALNHIHLFQMGDTSEPHMAHAAWNLLTIIEFHESGLAEEKGLDDRYYKGGQDDSES